ncbi:cell division protein kinase-like protein [Lophiotrema nucula]|uniref:cyclin-dependent kinase n=1 Tax=Lophiotrema nucula TaxID=690887 RepID=A0A6A5ZAY5_9PLEO|nr:cell division protein kinase-like protein [Lophiotrema nucula]
MASTSNWRSDLAFSARLSEVTRITTAFQSCNPSVSAVEAGTAAVAIETKKYDEAQSLADYERKCREKIEELLQRALTQVKLEKEDDAVPLPSPTGIDIGTYKNAVYHREGLYSVVYRATALDDSHGNYFSPGTPPRSRLVALKVTTPPVMQPPHDSRREAKILESSKSDHIIPLLDTFRQDGDHFVLVFPFMAFDLHQMLQDQLVSKHQAKHYLRDLLSGLVFIHSHNIIHRDIKPSNILIKSVDGPAYLSDFGIAWSPSTSGTERADSKITDVGTTCYRPPELLFGNKQYGCSLDLWAAGCTVAEVVVPGHPTLFDSGELGSDLALIQSMFSKLGTPNLTVWPEAANLPDWGKMQFREYPPQPWHALLPGAIDLDVGLVSELVKYESGARMTAAKALEHPYFVQ